MSTQPKGLKEEKPRNFYALIRPDTNEPFYIGATVKPLKDRLRNHRCNKGSKVAEMISRFPPNNPVRIELIKQQAEGEDWQEIERILISEHKATGYNLLNQAIGGLGGGGLIKSSEQRKEISIRNSKVVYDKNTLTGDEYTFYSAPEAAKHIGCTQPAITMQIKRGGTIKGYLVSLTPEFVQNENSKRYNKNKS